MRDLSDLSQTLSGVFGRLPDSERPLRGDSDYLARSILAPVCDVIEPATGDVTFLAQTTTVTQGPCLRTICPRLGRVRLGRR